MGKEDKIVMEGTVIQQLGGGWYQVEISEGVIVRAKLAGKLMKAKPGTKGKGKIKIVVGDRVKVELNEYDVTQGRIIQRLPVKTQSS